VAIPQSFIDELLARVDIVDVVGRYVPLRKAGTSFVGLCPFHSEKSPSFNVVPTKQFYHCFGCGASGDAIRFLMEHLGLGFIDAVEDLATQVGLTVPKEERSLADQARDAAERTRRQTLGLVLEQAAQAWRRALKDAPRAIEYLKGRGVSGAVARQYGLGYAPPGWHFLAGVFPNYDDPLLEESGLVITQGEDEGERRRYDRFRDRIMFPIRNIKGDCIGFGGRVLGDEKPKYLNSPETALFHKGRELYGLYEARQAIHQAGYALVTEGYMDVVALAQLGFPNAVATLGTACTPEHVQKLFRQTDSVVFSFDGDAAGRRAAQKALIAALPHATDLRSVRFLFLPPEHDPDSYIRALGQAAFAERVAEAVPLSRFLLEVAAQECDLDSAEGRARMVRAAQALWQALPEGALRLQILEDLARAAQMSTANLLAVWQANPATSGTPAGGRSDTAPHGAPTYPAAGRGHPGAVRFLGTSRRPLRRPAPIGKADHAARLVLDDMAQWEHLTHEDQALLCALPEPHGELFRWIDRTFHDQGPLPWGTLREALRGEPFEDLALRAMSLARELARGSDERRPHEAQQELRGLLNRMLLEHLSALENEAVAQAAEDPSALDRLRALHERRRQLQAGLDAVESPAPSP
jgi:DNA primase